MPSKVRVAHVALQLETGGMERLLVEFARHADATRFDVQFVALGSRGVIADDIEVAGCRVSALNTRPGVRPGLALELVRFFREQRIDIVHTHNTKPLLYAGPAARMAGTKAVIHTRHGQRHGATARQDVLFRLASKCADRIVGVSEDSRRLSRKDGLNPHATRRIWNGVDLERFGFRGPIAGGPAVFVGRLSLEKDVATLVRAAAIVVKEHPGFTLRVAGSGACLEDLTVLAASLGLGEHVQFCGNVSDVPGLLAGASMFVLPSLTEGLPLTVLEAMSCGLPVVATRTGGTMEAVEDLASGLLVGVREPAELARAIGRIWANAELGRDMGLAGRRRAEELFDVRAMVSRYEALYEEVLGGDVALAG